MNGRPKVALREFAGRMVPSVIFAGRTVPFATWDEAQKWARELADQVARMRAPRRRLRPADPPRLERCPECSLGVQTGPDGRPTHKLDCSRRGR